MPKYYVICFKLISSLIFSGLLILESTLIYAGIQILRLLIYNNVCALNIER